MIEEVLFLPSQWADMRRNIERSPAKRLYFAVWEDGINCYLGRGSIASSFETGRYWSALTAKRRKLQVEAEAWIYGSADAYVTFQECCDILGIEASWVRTQLKRVRRTNDNHQSETSVNQIARTARSDADTGAELTTGQG